MQSERQRRATWILLTDRLTLDAQTAVDDDKGQHHNEHGFRWTNPPIHLGVFWWEKPERVAGLGLSLVTGLTVRPLYAGGRAALQDQPPLQLPHRRFTHPSDTVILEVLRNLDMRYLSDGVQSRYQRAAVRPYQRRILEALEIPLDHGFVGDALG